MGRAVGWWGAGGWVPCGLGGPPSRFGGGFPLLGAQCELRHPPLRGDLPGPLGPIGKAIHRLAKFLVAAVDGEQRVQGPALPRASDVGVVGLVLPGVRVRARVLRGGGGVVGREEGVGAMYDPDASWCMVVGDGEGVVYVVHDGHVRGGSWLLVFGAVDVALVVVPEVAQGGHLVDPCLSFPRLSVGGGGAGWRVGHVGLVVAGAALGVHPPRHGISDKVWPPVDGRHLDSGPCGGRALAVRGGKWGAVLPGDLVESVEEEVSEALPQGGRLDEGHHPDALGGAGGVEA